MVSTAVAATLGTLGGIAALVAVAWPLSIYYIVDLKCEKPKYTVLRKLKTRKGLLGVATVAEVRHYMPYLYAEAEVGGPTMRDGLSVGFRAIAGFIFGKNTVPGAAGSSGKVAMTSPVTLEMDSKGPPSSKIAMTSPVTAEMAAGGAMKVSFIMPSEYTKETLPKPENSNVVIREMPARTLAALTWKGKSPREPQVEEKRAELAALLKEAGLRTQGPVHVWQYHPPFAPSFMRVNEVLLEVEGGQAAVQAAAES